MDSLDIIASCTETYILIIYYITFICTIYNYFIIAYNDITLKRIY